MKEVISIFTNHPTEEEVHGTSDGQLFFAKHHAESHASSLEDNRVLSITREKAFANAEVFNEFLNEQEEFEKTEAEKLEAEAAAKAEAEAAAKAEDEKAAAEKAEAEKAAAEKTTKNNSKNK